MIALIVFGLFKPMLAARWYYARRRFFWHNLDRLSGDRPLFRKP